MFFDRSIAKEEKQKIIDKLGETDISKYADIDEESDDIQEIDMDKIKNEINQSVGETLSKYFK